MLQLLKGSANSDMDVIGNVLFIGETDILKYKFTKCKYISKVITNERIYKQPYWSFVFGNINWNKSWTICEKYCMNNKIKEVTFKILHNIYPVKSVLERFRVINEYS